MATASPPAPDFTTLQRKTFRFDWITSLILASVVITAAVVLWLSAIWVTNRVWAVPTPSVPLDIIEIATDEEEGMRGESFEGGEAQIIVPSDLPAREENLTFDQPEIADVMASVLDAVAENQADFANPSRREGAEGTGRPGDPGGTGGQGSGEGSNAIPRYQRWSIHYSQDQTIPAYARLLDFFKIEIGVVRGESITYVSNFSSGKPLVKEGTAAGENRLHFVWQDAARVQADRELLQRANVPAADAVIAHFFPPALEEELAKLERDFAGKKPEEIHRTRFGVRRTQQGFEFHVTNQSTVGD